MKRDDYVQAFTSGLLALDGEPAAAAQAHFGQRFEFQELKKPQAVSLGGRGPAGDALSYAAWLQALRAEGLRGVRFSWGAKPADPSLPPHVAVAFAGVRTLLFQVETATAARTYELHTRQSPQVALTPAQFVELMDAQEQKALLWERVRELVHESNELNSRPAVAPGQAAAYLLSPEGAEVYDFLVMDLCQEVQLECLVRETPFRIPPHLKDAFYQSDFSFGLPERDPVFLYPEKQDIAPQELRALIQAQPFPPSDIWVRADARLREYTDPALLPASPGAWPTALDGLSDALKRSVPQAVCDAIRTLCEEQQQEPIIPEALKAHFGPDALEKKRAKARGRLSGGEQWRLQDNPQPWQLLFFEEVPGAGPTEPPGEAAQAKARFQEALRAIEAFAARLDFPFAEAFRLGRALLEQDFPRGDFDAAHGQRALEALQAKGFSERAQENFQEVFSFAEDLRILRWPAERILGFLAASVSDVFGGMGSWNDLPLDEADGEENERLSAELFRSMKDYAAVLQSWVKA
ncbi:hypothetical protein [Stigmatella erecta]|uniref:Uncharacterized protein n=1 Tax=Stigmatella erecta TaxID=83460 RepID=A0A1I0LD23_9BACT|nr:hypothetical protein [Stigmatella erecta]SEU38012.1 hypothetical protein SAMN05443639_12553 [Stigmatella erecta]